MCGWLAGGAVARNVRSDNEVLVKDSFTGCSSMVDGAQDGEAVDCVVTDVTSLSSDRWQGRLAKQHPVGGISGIRNIAATHMLIINWLAIGFAVASS